MKQYRTLNDGEIVMAGDEFWGIDRSWTPATEIGKKVTSYTHKMYRRPMTETSSQTTDTCPDCSDIPCDCGLPAGYQSDIRFAANFAPHIKVMEASNVAEIIQQRDDLLRYNEAFRQETLICSDCDAISKEEYDQAIQQLDAAQKEIERLQCAGIHSCHDNCERPNCVLRREIKALTEQRDGLRAGIDYASDQLTAVTEQLDEMTLRWELTNDSLFDKRALADRLAEELTTTRQAHDVVVLAFRKVDAELTAVTEQRDRMAEACKALMKIVGEPNSTIDDCWVSEDEMDAAWNMGNEALAAVKGGVDE